MVEEANNSHRSYRKPSTNAYRNFPVQFVKAKELYDPSDFIRSIQAQVQARTKLQTPAESNIEFSEISVATYTTQENFVNGQSEISMAINGLSANNNSGVHTDLSIHASTINAQLLDLESDLQSDLQSNIESTPNTAISESFLSLQVSDLAIDKEQTDLKAVPVLFTNSDTYEDLQELEVAGEESEETDLDEVEIDDFGLEADNGNDINLDSEDSEDSDLDAEESVVLEIDTEEIELESDTNTNDAPDPESEESDEFDLTALSFLVKRDMHGGDDMYIEDPPSPQLKRNKRNPSKSKSKSKSRQNGFTLQGIQKIIKTGVRYDDELIFIVHRSSKGSSIFPETVSYSEILEENEDNATVEEINEAIRCLGGTLETGTPVSSKLPLDVAYMIESLSNLQGSSSKGKKNRALKKLSAVAKKVEPTYDSSSKSNRKDRPPSFSSADPSLRESLVDSWYSAKSSRSTKKLAREVLRAEGKLSKEYKEHEIVNLKDKYLQKMTIFDVVNEMEVYLKNPEKNSLSFPPMGPKARTIIRKLSSAYYITPNTFGAGKGRGIVCTKTYKSSFADRDVDYIRGMINEYANKKLGVAKPQTQANGGGKKEPKVPKVQKATQVHKEGDIVGQHADALDVTNLGHQMLGRLGWKEGMALGSSNQGIQTPIFAKVKLKKYGLGG